MKKQEFYLQATICDYINKFYPDVLYRSDLSGIKMTIGQAKLIKLIQKYRGWPDIIIYEQAQFISDNFDFFYQGLAIEIKNNKSDVYTKFGKLKNNKHIEEQEKMLKKLRNLGYKAIFGTGFDNIKEEIDNYLKGRQL